MILGEALMLEFPLPKWIPELKQRAEQCGWLLEQNIERSGALALRFFRSGKWISIFCETNGNVKVENQNIDGSYRMSLLKAMFD